MKRYKCIFGLNEIQFSSHTTASGHDYIMIEWIQKDILDNAVRIHTKDFIDILACLWKSATQDDNR